MQNQLALLDSLEIQIRDLMQLVRSDFADLDESILKNQPDPVAWNALECLAHLNSYAELYIPLFEKAVHKAKARQWLPEEEVKYSWMGRWAINSVQVADSGKMKKMKAPKSHNHKGEVLTKTEVKAFLVNQERLLRVINSARAVNLNKAKTAMAIFPYTKLNLGNFLEFIVTHEERHIIQATRCIGLEEVVAND